MNKLVDIGASYLHSMANVDSINNPDEDALVQNSVAGVALNMVWHINNVDMIAEYVSALSPFAANIDVTNKHKIQPSAYQLEAVYNLRKLQFMLGYQASSDAQALNLPEKRFLIGGTYALQDSTNIALQVARDSLYSNSNQAVENQVSFTTQLSVEF